MRNLFLTILLFLLTSCTTTSQMQSQTVIPKPSQLPTANLKKTLTTSNESMVDALVVAPNLYVEYVEDGAADGTVLAIYPNSDGYATNPIAKEVKDIVALRDKAIPLLIEHLDDTRPTWATVSSRGYITDKPVRVPVGYICLDILLNIVGIKNKLIYAEEERGGFGSEIKDGYYFRPDDYRIISDIFEERPIVRIVKSNWQKAYQDGKIKYDYVVAWK